MKSIILALLALTPLAVQAQISRFDFATTGPNEAMAIAFVSPDSLRSHGAVLLLPMSALTPVRVIGNESLCVIRTDATRSVAQVSCDLRPDCPPVEISAAEKAALLASGHPNHALAVKADAPVVFYWQNEPFRDEN